MALCAQLSCVRQVSVSVTSTAELEVERSSPPVDPFLLTFDMALWKFLTVRSFS